MRTASLKIVNWTIVTLFLCWIMRGTSSGAVVSQANVPCEIALNAAQSHPDAFNKVEVDVLFTGPDGKRVKVPAFWDGGRVWKVRYASPRIGIHRYITMCSDVNDKGLNGIRGTVIVKPYSGTNALYKHGEIHVAPDNRHLQYADGTPFFWSGDTWWMGLCHRLRWPTEFKTLTADRKAKGFNVIQIVAGLYPDMHAFDPRGANEVGFPWSQEYSAIRPEYFDAADKRLRYLVDQGFTPCIVGAWGYFLPWMGPVKMKQHWRYLIARYGSWPVVWCAAGEANLPWYLAKGFPYDDREQARGWTEIVRYIKATDPFHRLLTIHPTAINYYTSRHAMDDPRFLDFDMLQTPHGRQEAVPIAINAVRQSYAASPTMPVIDGEASYEMLGDSLPTQWTRAMFWVCLLNGAAGHTYGANGIWQCNRRGEPHGKSPHGGSYGVIPWDVVMRLPGSSQLGMAKRLFERQPWQQFKPHPEWASFGQNEEVNLDSCRWIWYPEGDPAKDAPTEKRYFRMEFELPQDKEVASARLRFSADDYATARVNGKELGDCSDWHAGSQCEAGRFLRHGANVVAIMAENRPAPVTANPAGLMASLDVRFADGQTMVLNSNSEWRCARTEFAGWDVVGYDDTAWVHAKEIGRNGDAPWGKIGVRDSLDEPQTAGTDAVRITWVPRSEPILLSRLASKPYRAVYFDPVTGKSTAVGTIHADLNGKWQCNPPVGSDHDWVLVMEQTSRFSSRPRADKR